MEELIKLKGVARKTANIILGNAFGKVIGIAVDTHVWRLSHRLGLSKQKNRDAIHDGIDANNNTNSVKKYSQISCNKNFIR